MSVYDRLENPSAIQCNSPSSLRGKSLFSVNDTEFCKEPTQEHPDNNNKLIIAITVSILIPIIFLILFLIMNIFRVKLFSTLGVHPFNRDECEGEEMNYDVFLSFAHEDTTKARELLNFLELNSCEVCFHQRDFIPGNLIAANIQEAIVTSKRVLCLITENFLTSNYCMEEFHMALARSITLKKRRVIVIMSSNFRFPQNIHELASSLSHNEECNKTLDGSCLEGSSHDQPPLFEDRSLTLRDFVNRYTYIDYDVEGWEQQLLYGMPVNKFYGIYIIYIIIYILEI